MPKQATTDEARDGIRRVVVPGDDYARDDFDTDSQEPGFEYEPPREVLDPSIATNLPMDADPPETRHPATNLGSLMEGLLKKLFPPEREWTNVMAGQWADWVGAETAAYTRPGKFVDGTLFVYVKGSVRLAELKRHQMQAIDSRVRQKVGGKVRSIRLVVDPGD